MIHTSIRVVIMLMVLSVCPALCAEVVSSDRHLVLFDTGVIYDAKSGLDWYGGPDHAMTWEEARRWVSGLKIDDGGWRMPTRKELTALHHIGDGVSNITNLLKTSGYWIWAGQTLSSSSRWVFSFSYGGEGWSGQAPDDGGRAIAVRTHQQ